MLCAWLRRTTADENEMLLRLGLGRSIFVIKGAVEREVFIDQALIPCCQGRLSYSGQTHGFGLYFWSMWADGNE
jgi:hypothetical protein